MSASERPNALPVAIGILLTCVLLFLLGYLARKRSADQRDVPQLQIVDPHTNTVVNAPVALRFTSTQNLALQQTGWGYGGLHLHAWLNDVQHMPAATDIIRAADGSYAWTLPQSQPGPAQTLRLGWADSAHRPIAAGASPAIVITVE